jgi:hypothetical protein
MRRHLQHRFCLRQQGTSPIFIIDFSPSGRKIDDKKKKKYHSAEGRNQSWQIAT